MNSAGVYPSQDRPKDPAHVPKRRSSRACDQCRRSKGKCERASLVDPCESCIIGSLECTTSGPNLKRGPQKGYLRAVETQLHAVESILGVILSIPDPTFRQQLSYLNSDPYAELILSRIVNGSFGPARCMIEGPDVIPPPTDGIYSPEDRDGANPFAVGANNRWQQYILSKYYHKRHVGEAGNYQMRSYQHQGMSGGQLPQIQYYPQPSGSGQLQYYLEDMFRHTYNMQTPSSAFVKPPPSSSPVITQGPTYSQLPVPGYRFNLANKVQTPIDTHRTSVALGMEATSEGSSFPRFGVGLKSNSFEGWLQAAAENGHSAMAYKQTNTGFNPEQPR